MSLDLHDVREWASTNDIAVAARGRVPISVKAGYLYAHSSVARSLGEELGVPIPTRGRVSFDACQRIAQAI